MQKEHDAQLAKERELIVHQVLQSLETKGLLRRKKPSTRHHHHKHPTKLDTRLQALVRHSLTDSGLDYPHVIPSQNTTVSSSHVRPLVLERKDTTDEPMEARRVSARQGSTQGDSRPQRHVDAALPPATAADPPNQVVPCAEKSILTRSKRSSKMSKKTWVMLEQSKKLLQATKTSGYKPGVIAPKPHLDQILAHNEQRPNDGTGIVMATWCALAVPLTEAKLSPYADDLDGAAMLCRHRLCHELRHLEQSLELEQYLAVVETLLMSRVRAKQQHQQDKVLDELDVKLWKQLVITGKMGLQK
ncbi:hypothetical protein DYB30_004602 [Aphanomyces astaci]|uniref:Uncharacterized protein n=1 Tax=Aphanomyces astaci TaxID=112090 RepID=A0A397CGD4_APHAT|nr:hypothetical protein DYB30_004602 [Aphanomyces astaci]